MLLVPINDSLDAVSTFGTNELKSTNEICCNWKFSLAVFLYDSDRDPDLDPDLDPDPDRDRFPFRINDLELPTILVGFGS